MEKLRSICLKNKNGTELVLTNYGATIMRFNLLDKAADKINVAVGLRSVEDYIDRPYLDKNIYLGCTVGRYAGRISKGYFELDGVVYPIENKAGIHLHGGKKGFDKCLFDIEEIHQEKDPYVIFGYLSKDLEEGYPGNLKLIVKFTLTEENEIRIEYSATTDRATIVTLTNPTYFNLDGMESVLDHSLQISSDEYVEFDAQLIPTGKILPTKNTRFDYQILKKIGEPVFMGLDEAFVLNVSDIKAKLYSSKSGIEMQVLTDQPAMVVYTPPQLPDLPYHHGVQFSRFSAICFETQHYPDSPHNSHFPNVILRPNEKYQQKTTYRFKLKKG